MATYTVKAGDTLSKIAQSQGVGVSDITGYKSGDANLIYPGETLTVGSPKNTNTGITTSDDAANRAKTANTTLDSISKKVKSTYTTTDGQKVTLYTDGTKTYSGSDSSKTSSKTSTTTEFNPFTALYDQINVLQSNLNKAKEAEKAAKEEAAGLDAKSALKKVTSSEEVATQGQADLTAAGNAISGNGDTSGIFDPMIKMYTDTFIANASIINNQAKTLEQYREQFNDYTQQDIDSIVRTAARSVATQEAENKRTTDAMRFAGVLGGRAQFAPVTEQSIIKDVIQEGLDKIEVINEKKNTAIREARKAEAEFNIDIFEQQANLAKEYNNQIQETFSALNTRVREAEQDERARVEFRQGQEERNSLILAEELTDATPDMIAQAALANGVDVGLLTKAVNDAKYNKQDRALSLEAQRAAINASNRSNQPKTEEKGFSREEEALLRQAGLDGASYDEQVTFLNMTASERSAKIKEVQDEKKEDEDMSVTDFIANMVGKSSVWKSGEFPDNIKASATSFGINPKGVFNDKEARNFLGTIVQNLKTTYPEITDTEVKKYLKEIPADATPEELTAYFQFARTGLK